MRGRYPRPRPLRYPVSVNGGGAPWRFRGEIPARTIRFVDSESLCRANSLGERVSLTDSCTVGVHAKLKLETLIRENGKLPFILLLCRLSCNIQDISKINESLLRLF